MSILLMSRGRVVAADFLAFQEAILTFLQDGDYHNCPVTQALLDLLASDKNKDVRKAALASLPLVNGVEDEAKASQFTIPHVLARTLDDAEEVST